MADYTLRVTVAKPYADAVDAARSTLGEQGFGVLTEIDMAATLKAKLGVDISPQVILGVCRPPLAYEALQADPSIAALLPCNVVVRALDDQTSMVEAFDPAAMTNLTDSTALDSVVRDARHRLTRALAVLAEED